MPLRSPSPYVFFRLYFGLLLKQLLFIRSVTPTHHFFSFQSTIFFSVIPSSNGLCEPNPGRHHYLQNYHKSKNVYIGISCQIIWRNMPLFWVNHTWVHFVFIWTRHGSSKTVECTTSFSILSDDGSRRETGLYLFQNWCLFLFQNWCLFFFQNWCHLYEQTNTMDLYPPALGTIPFGYWASRVLGPSSKAREGFGLYT